MLKRFATIGYAAAIATSPAWMTACSSPTDAASAEDPTVMFSLTADSMRFEDPHGTDVTLVMEGVDPHAIWFTDRPERESGTITTSQLAAEWGEGESFTEDPPNAALVLHQPVQTEDGITETLVVEVLNANYDEASDAFRADLRILEDEELGTVGGNLAAHAGRHDVAWPTEAGAVSLFIDSITLCTTPATCKSNTTQNYTYNSTIYFQATITENVTSSPAITEAAPFTSIESRF